MFVTGKDMGCGFSLTLAGRVCKSFAGWERICFGAGALRLSELCDGEDSAIHGSIAIANLERCTLEIEGKANGLVVARVSATGARQLDTSNVGRVAREDRRAWEEERNKEMQMR